MATQEEASLLSAELRLLPPAESLPLQERLENFLRKLTAERNAFFDAQTAEKNTFFDEQRAASDARHKLSEQKQKASFDALCALVDEALHYVPPVSILHLGKQCLEVLERCGRVSELTPSPGDASILTLEEQASLVTLSQGAWGEGKGFPAVQLSISARLAALRLQQPPPGVGAAAGELSPLGPVLIRCTGDDCQWLERKGARQRPEDAYKPDFFQSWEPFVLPRDYVEGQPLERGVLSSPALQALGCTTELYVGSNWALGAHSLGTICTFLQCLPGLTKGILFSPTQCWLYEALHGMPSRLLKLDWTTPGSAPALCDFLGSPVPPPLLLVLQRLLDDLGMALMRVRGGVCHLGSGGSGHVFAVHAKGDPHRTPLALKVFPATSVYHMESEVMTLGGLVGKGSVPVVHLVPESLRMFPRVGPSPLEGEEKDEEEVSHSGGYLLGEVGEPFNWQGQGSSAVAFETLARLHACNIFHGDARKPNFLSVGGVPKWIDLGGGMLQWTFGVRERGAPLARASMRMDASSLARSILCLEGKEGLLPAPVNLALDDYNPSLPDTVTNLGKIVEQLKPEQLKPLKP